MIFYILNLSYLKKIDLKLVQKLKMQDTVRANLRKKTGCVITVAEVQTRFMAVKKSCCDCVVNFSTFLSAARQTLFPLVPPCIPVPKSPKVPQSLSYSHRRAFSFSMRITNV